MERLYIELEVVGLKVKLPAMRVNETTLNYIVPRAMPQEMNMKYGDYTLNTSMIEFMDDVLFQVPSSLEGSNEDIAFESLYQVVVRHIQRYGRILPVDLDSYIAQNILLFNSILVAQHKTALTEAEQEERFSKFNYLVFGILPQPLKDAYMFAANNP